MFCFDCLQSNMDSALKCVNKIIVVFFPYRYLKANRLIFFIIKKTLGEKTCGIKSRRRQSKNTHDSLNNLLTKKKSPNNEFSRRTDDGELEGHDR